MIKLYELVEKLEELTFVSRVSRVKNLLYLYDQTENLIAYIPTNSNEIKYVNSKLDPDQERSIEELFQLFRQTPVKLRLLPKKGDVKK